MESIMWWKGNLVKQTKSTNKMCSNGGTRIFPASTTFIISTLISIFLLCTTCLSAYKIESPEDALSYLSHFGYLAEAEQTADDDEGTFFYGAREARNAVSHFQNLVHLKPNGILNEQTISMMNRPRCGNRDERIEEGDELEPDLRRQRRHAESDVKITSTIGIRWNKPVLTYKIIQYASTSLKPKTLQKEIDLAFKYWEREANLTFKKIWEGNADIEVGFFRGEHGDEESFDGPSKTLAHAFYPTKGDIHFDDEEMWTADVRKGHNLRMVAVHEIGHALGLTHSKEEKAVMFAVYQGFRRKLSLHENDVEAIQSLYGPKFAESNVNENMGGVARLNALQGMISNPRPDLCVDPTIDAISTLVDRHIYIFKGEHYFRIDRMGGRISKKYPRRINETFTGLPSHLDTVLTVPNGKTYFFKGKHYWRSTGTSMDSGYPKKISGNFRGIPNDLEAAFVWSWNNDIYFFKKHRYWRFNFETNSVNSTAYPKKVASNWPGIPDAGVEDAFRAPNGRTYFFKDGDYWQFHDPESYQEAASYPRSSLLWWFHCTDFKPDVRKVRHMRRKKSSVYI